MNGLNEMEVAGAGLQPGRLISLEEVAKIILLRIQIRELPQ
jgi:hypothetical protein